ncbi:MAG TPA: YeeE/YedE family protein [Burkholderiales bacterium]|nr:YeeE/YedE family protein [Burkholderiales bacterium]
MESHIHAIVLLSAFAIAAIMGAVMNKTHFCTMGAVSDWVNIGDTGRMRAWVFAMAVALAGALALEATGTVNLDKEVFPPYRNGAFAWLRYLVGGLFFGIGMTLASGCGTRTMVRIGGGNAKSLVVLAFGALAAYWMMWTPLWAKAFHPWIQPATVSLPRHGVASQELSAVLAAMFGAQATPTLHLVVGAAVVAGMLWFVWKSVDFRGSRDNILGGAVVGLAVAAGWWLTGGPVGKSWKEFVNFNLDVMPVRVQTQSYTYVSPMGDALHYLLDPANFSLVTFGVAGMAGVIAGSLVWAIATRTFRVEWFASWGDFGHHAVGGVLMGVGGVLALGCTIGQAVTGVSTLAIGSMLTFFSIVIGSVGTMKYQYWRISREA